MIDVEKSEIHPVLLQTMFCRHLCRQTFGKMGLGCNLLILTLLRGKMEPQIVEKKRRGMNYSKKGAWWMEIPLEVRGKCRRGFSSTPKAHLAHPASTPDPIGNLFGWLIILKERTT